VTLPLAIFLEIGTNEKESGFLYVGTISYT